MNSQWLSLALQAAPQQSGDPKMMILMIAMMGLAFWLIIMRPQKREQQRRQGMLDNIKKGDKIVTIGGIHGWVTDVEKGGRTLSIRIDTKTIVKVERSAISRIEGAEAEEPPAAQEEKK